MKVGKIRSYGIHRKVVELACQNLQGATLCISRIACNLDYLLFRDYSQLLKWRKSWNMNGRVIEDSQPRLTRRSGELRHFQRYLLSCRGGLFNCNDLVREGLEWRKNRLRTYRIVLKYLIIVPL
jgi:hypothetical protein